MYELLINYESLKAENLSTREIIDILECQCDFKRFNIIVFVHLIKKIGV